MQDQFRYECWCSVSAFDSFSVGSPAVCLFILASKPSEIQNLSTKVGRNLPPFIIPPILMKQQLWAAQPRQVRVHVGCLQHLVCVNMSARSQAPRDRYASY